jgi:glycosyltransferase involved in cell wall biosynthesis
VRRAVARADLVFAQTVDCVVPIVLAERMGKPWTLYLHGIDWEVLPRVFGSPALARALVPAVRAWSRFWTGRAGRLFLPSASMARILREARIEVPVETAPPGVDADRFRPPADRPAAKRALGLPGEALVLGYTGRLAHEKNVALLFETFEALAPRFPELRLLLVGTGLPGYLRRAAGEDRILAVGQREDVLPYLHAMDLFLMPSRTETSSLSTMEAMCAGVPAVTFPVGCIPDYLADGAGGRLADPLDPAGFREAAASLLGDPALRGRMGEVAREVMLRRGGWEATADALAGAFEEILEARARVPAVRAPGQAAAVVGAEETGRIVNGVSP